MSDDITNRGLGKWLTLETVGSLLAMAFIFGTGYMSLAAADTAASKEIKNTNEKISDMADEQKQLSKGMSIIQADIRVMKNDQVHIDNHMKNQEATLKEVVKLLRERR